MSRGYPVHGEPVHGSPVKAYPVGGDPVQGEGEFRVRKFVDSSVCNPTDVLLYTLVVTNTSGDDVSNVVVTDDIDSLLATYVNGSGTVDHPNGTITNDTGSIEVTFTSVPDGESANITYQVTATGEGNIVNTAEWTVDGGPPESSNEITVLCVAPASFSVTKVAAPDDFINPGYPVTYQVTISNSGGLAIGCNYLDPIQEEKADFAPMSVSTTKGTILSGQMVDDIEVEVDIGQIANGESVVIQYTLVVKDPYPFALPDNLINQGTLSGGNFGDVQSNQIIIPIEAIPVIPVLKDVTPNPVFEGGSVAYRVTIDTTGQSNWRNVIGTDSLGPNLTLDHTQTQTTQGTILTGDQPGDDKIEISFGNITPNSLIYVDYVCTVPDPFTGFILNKMIFLSDNAPDRETNEVSLTVLARTPSMAAVKAANTGNASPGDTLTYTIDITNTGNRDALSVSFTDSISDAGITLVPSSVVAPGGTIVSDVGTVQVDYTSISQGGGTVQLTYQCLVEDPFPGGLPGQVTNQGAVSGSNFNTINTNIELVDIAAIPVPAWNLSYTVDDASPTVGDNIHFTMTIQNSGTAEATTVEITNVVPSEFGNFTGLTSTHGTPSFAGNTLTLALASFPAAQTTVIEFDADVQTSGSFGDTYTVDCSEIVQAVSPTINFTISDTFSATQVKSSNVVGDANPGDTITYTVDIESTGSGDLTGTVLEDEISDANLTLVPGSATTDVGTVTQDDTRVEIAVGTLTGQGQITYQATVAAGMTVPGVVSNQATLDATQIAPQNTNLLQVNVVDAGTGPILITSFANMGFEADSLAPGGRVTPAQGWNTISAEHPTDAIDAYEGDNVGWLNASTTPPYASQRSSTDTFTADKTYRLTAKMRAAVPYGSETAPTILMNVGFEGDQLQGQRCIVAVEGADDWGKMCTYITPANSYDNMVFAARAFYDQETYIDDVQVHEMPGYHPSQEARMTGNGVRESASAATVESDHIGNGPGVTATPPTAGTSVGSLLILTQGDPVNSNYVQSVNGKRPVLQANGSLKFTNAGASVLRVNLTGLIIPAPWTCLIRLKCFAGSNTGFILGWGTNNAAGIRIRADQNRFDFRTGGTNYDGLLDISNFISGDSILICHVESGNTFMAEYGGAQDSSSAPVFNFIETAVGPQTDVSWGHPEMEFWGYVCYPGAYSTSKNDQIAAYLNSLGS